MLIRSINGETPEGAVPVEDRGMVKQPEGVHHQKFPFIEFYVIAHGVMKTT